MITHNSALLSVGLQAWPSVGLACLPQLTTSLASAQLTRKPLAIEQHAQASAPPLASGIRSFATGSTLGLPQRPLREDVLKQLSMNLRGFAASSIPKSQPEDKERTIGAPPTPQGGPLGTGKSFDAGFVAPHPGMRSTGAPAVVSPDKESFMEHPEYYDVKYLESIRPIHIPPKDAADRVGYAAVLLLRRSFDFFTGYGPNMTAAKWVQRVIFLETVAGVPGMVAGMLRHLHSLRLFRRDQGWIHTLLEEAENERMHLLTFFELRQPGPLFRAMVLLSQGIFFNAYFLAYLLWPKACHSFVGYLEEEAVRTYTHMIKDIEAGKLWKDQQVPAIAKTYWQLKPGCTMRDLILAIRADEACHSHVNHTLKKLKASDPNPFALGKSHLP